MTGWQSITGAVVSVCLLSLAPASAFEWTPTNEEIRKYRSSWNPLSEGPLLIQSVDIHPKGQLSIRPFLFSQISEKQYGNKLSLPDNRTSGTAHTYSVSPLAVLTYGVSDHFEVGVATSLQSFWTKDSSAFNQGRGGPWNTDTGMGDFSVQMKYRPLVQDPDTSRPSLTLYQQLVLPTSRWVTGTERPPGGFAPLGRLPATRFGELSLTEGVTFRKNVRPFRVSGGVFYSYATPGSDAGQTTYVGDTINTRLSFEHFLDDEKGFAYNLEFTTVHTATWRADGHTVNKGSLHGSTVIGIEPAIQWRLSDSWVAAAGVLVTVAGQNTADAIYPNFAFRWFWNQGNKAIMP
ncbi:MAG: hypothetical protein ACKOBZ_01050 [Nitrospira sp.]